MTARRRSPQEDKVLSYAKDRRNGYGENDKSSRRAIRVRKQWVNGTYRSRVHDALSNPNNDPDLIDQAVGSVVRPYWRKYRDETLGDVVGWKLSARQNRPGTQAAKTTPGSANNQLRSEAARRTQRASR
jgi:hypothetical protein